MLSSEKLDELFSPTGSLTDVLSFKSAQKPKAEGFPTIVSNLGKDYISDIVISEKDVF